MTTAIVSDYLEEKLINHTFRNTAYTSPGTSIYVALHTANPTDAGTGAEVTFTNYARQQVTAWDAPGSSRATQNTNAITFPTPGSNGNAQVTHIGIWDAATSGNLLFYGALTTPKDIQNGIPFSIAAGALDISFGGAISNYLAGKWIDHVLRNTAYTSPGTSIYIGLSTTQTAAAGGTPASGNNYSRVNVTAWDAPSSTNGATQNTGAINFATPSGTWGTPDSVDIWDASTSGNLLYFGSITGGGAISANDAVSFAAGALDITIS